MLSSPRNALTKKGTDTELLQILSALESSRDNQQGIDLMTWDIRKAFVSVGQNLQYLSWRRVGVPKTIAYWLVQLDVGGTFTVRSPYIMNQLLQAPTSALPSSQEGTRLLRRFGFIARQDLTQGDIKSPIGWAAAFDILLTAFRDLTLQGELKPVFIHHVGSALYAAMAWAYADDLVTISALVLKKA